MSLIHRFSEVGAGVVALECHTCSARYTEAQFELLGEGGNAAMLCEQCGRGGFIPHKGWRMEDRFPLELASRFTPLPEALMDHRERLRLEPNDLLLIWALERFRRSMGHEVFPSRARLMRLTDRSRWQLQQAISRTKLGGRQERRDGPSYRNLDALWLRVAALERRPADDGIPGTEVDVLGDGGPTSEPRTAEPFEGGWLADQHPGDGIPGTADDGIPGTEVDVWEVDTTKENPYGTTSAAAERRDDPPSSGLSSEDEEAARVHHAFQADWQANYPDLPPLPAWTRFKARFKDAA